MISRVLFLGARYIELEIFNKEVRNDTIPVVSSGYNKGNMKLQLNSIDLGDCLDMIASMAFSESHLDNFNDPLFLFLNLKVNGNKNTLNKIGCMVRNKLSNRLLSKKYLAKNMGNATLCELKGKVVIFCNEGWRDTVLDEVVNSATDTPNLKRLTMNEIANYSERSKPKFSVRSNNIQFSKGTLNGEIKFLDYGIDLVARGMKSTDNVIIKGAGNQENNSSIMPFKPFKVDNISKDSILFNKSVNLVSEAPGAMVSIEVYDQSYTGQLEDLESYNKNNLTICVPDDSLDSANYNYKSAMYKGCQFIAMNYQTVDKSMKAYFQHFIERSFHFKPSALINPNAVPNVESLALMIPGKKPSIEYNVDYDFFENIDEEITLNVQDNKDLYVGNDKDDSSSPPTPKILLDADETEIEFLVEKGLDNMNDTISFKHKSTKTYLTVILNDDDKPPSLSFTPLPKDDSDINDKKARMSFIPLKPLVSSSKKNVNSFGFKIRETSGDITEEVIYYLKFDKKFNPNKKLFTKSTNRYDFKAILLDGDSDNSGTYDDKNLLVVLTPTDDSDYLPLGDVMYKLSDVGLTTKSLTGKDQPAWDKIGHDDLAKINIEETLTDKNTLLVSGDVAHPVDYELIYKNKLPDSTATTNTRLHYIEDQQFSIWKPIAPAGYVALGVVCQNSYKKPLRNIIYTVSTTYVKEQAYSQVFYKGIYKYSSDSSSGSSATSESTSANKNIMHYCLPKVYDSSQPPSLVFWTRDNPTEGDPKVVDNYEDPIGFKPPNPFDNPQFVLNIDTDAEIDKIFLSNKIEDDKEDRKSCMFTVNVISRPPDDGGTRYDNLLKIEKTDSKLVSYTKNEGGGKMCMGLPQPYWSSYYQEATIDPEPAVKDSMLDSTLLAMNCGDSSNFGTNFKSYSDNSIRLSNNNKYCVTHTPLSNGKPNTVIEDPSNFIFLEECNANLVNQRFLIDDNNLQVFNGRTSEGNTCITHAPDNKLRLEECGDQKYTALYLWEDQIFRDDKCFKDEADERLAEVGAMEKCIDRSYFVIYMDGIIKHIEFCSKKEAEVHYNKIVKDYAGGVIIAHKEQPIKKSFDGSIPSNFLNKIYNLSTIKGACYECDRPSKMLCSKQRLEESTLNSFNNFKEEQRLTDYCMKMKETDEFRCGRANRQKFVNFPLPEDYCVNVGQKIYVEFPSAEISDVANVETIKKLFERTSSGTPKEQFPVQNLLGEVYDHSTYTVFLSAKIVKADATKYTILFKSLDNVPTLKQNMFKIDRLSDYFCLDYEPKPYMIDLGTKVIIKFQQFNKEEDINEALITKDNIRYLGVVIKKLSSTTFRVMLSINSYESNKKKKMKVGAKYYTSNPVEDVDIKDIVIYKKANKCPSN